MNNSNDNFKPDPHNKNNGDKRVIRTYRDFAIDALEDKPTSLAKMIIKEKEKRVIREERSIKNPKNIFMIMVSSILVILGVFVVASVIIFVNTKKEEIVEKKTIPNIQMSIEAKYKRPVNLVDINDIKDAADTAYGATIDFGSILSMYFVVKDELGYSRQATAKEFLKILDTRVPNQFLRNLKDRFTTGIVSLDENKPFMILETLNFDASYNNMLSWEKTMLYDIGSLFRINQRYYANQFTDIILFNKDIRAVLDDEGNLVFGYSFVDPYKIVFFTDSQVFKIILNNLKNFTKK